MACTESRSNSGKNRGDVDDASSDLEFGCENGSNIDPQMVGLRFPNITLPAGRTITKAYIQFEVDATNKNADPCVQVIRAGDSVNPGTFPYVAYALTSRAKLADSVVWSIASGSFSVVDAKQNSADISALVQLLVNKSGWASGNAMSFFITGTGTREVESYNGEAAAAAALFIEYTTTAQEDSLALKAKADSILASAAALVDTNYTIPSWTLMLRAKTTLSTAVDSTKIASLQSAIATLQLKTKPYSITADINGDPSSRMGFAWFTNQNITGGGVQIVAGATNDTAAFAVPAQFVAATSTAVANLNYNVSGNALSSLAGIADNTKKNYTSNKALITGLTANTAYSYRVGKTGAWSDIGHFTTAKTTKDPFSFIYFTDPQANTDAMFAVSSKTMHAAQSAYPNANFILSCGDLIETSGSPNSEWEYEQFFLTQQDIWLKYPFAPIIGNHDKSTNKNFSYHFNTAVTSFDSAMSTTPGSVYSFVYGGALFMALSYEDYSVAGYLDSLKRWVKKTVAANPNVQWKIAFYHKTMFTGSQSHQSDADGKAVRDSMGPLFDSLKIDLALQGHDHIYEVIGPVKNKTLVPNAVTGRTVVTADARANVSGYLGRTFNVTNGTLYFLNNSAGKKKYEPCSKAHMDSVGTGLGIDNYFSLFTGRFGQTGEPTFSTIKVSTDSINITTYTVNDSGTATLFDAFKIIKPASRVNTPVQQNGLQNALSVRINHNAHTVHIALNCDNEAVHVSIFNCAGKTIMSQSSTARNTTVSFSSLPAGQYFLKVRAGAEQAHMRFVKL